MKDDKKRPLSSPEVTPEKHKVVKTATHVSVLRAEELRRTVNEVCSSPVLSTPAKHKSGASEIEVDVPGVPETIVATPASPHTSPNISQKIYCFLILIWIFFLKCLNLFTKWIKEI